METESSWKHKGTFGRTFLSCLNFEWRIDDDIHSYIRHGAIGVGKVTQNTVVRVDSEIGNRKMAGTLPGVGVGSRRMRHHHRQDDPLVFREPPSFRERLQHSTTITMGETALLARQRLDRKLAHFRASSRSSKQGANGSRESSHKARTKSNSIGSKILGRPWKLQLNTSSKSKTDGEMCSVCLEDFEEEQQMMELSCSHKYHSKCLMPWLASHPHCPTCRNPVQCA